MLRLTTPASTPLATPASPYRYWAFISYSSADRSWARWLQRAIESYGIPARLTDHATPTGEPAPKRFKPLFRDRSELAAGDLGAQIEAALEASRYLIVVCSPRAAASEWVNKEIASFQALGRADRVFAVVVDGEPNAGDERECFPPALRDTEPLAADARPEGDGKRDARLKLLAGMLGVGFDALKQRDQHRRLRRLQATVAAVLVLAAGFAGLAAYAFQQRSTAIEQRDTADRARSRAETILEYVLYDLRSQLDELGRLDIVAEVQQAVDEYYLHLGVDEGDPRVLHNRAAAAMNKGDRLMDQGDLPGARRQYQFALGILQNAVESRPTELTLDRDLSVVHDRIGNVLEAQGDLAGSLEHYRRALGISQTLVGLDPDNNEWQSDVLTSHKKVGGVLEKLGNTDDAVQHYRAALQIIQRLADSDPDNTEWQRDLFVVHTDIGSVLEKMGVRAGENRHYAAALRIARALAARWGQRRLAE